VTYLDRTFCARPGCTCPPERRLTTEIEEAARRVGLLLSMAYLCAGKDAET
jgi:hypothetical protein